MTAARPFVIGLDLSLSRTGYAAATGDLYSIGYTVGGAQDRGRRLHGLREKLRARILATLPKVPGATIDLAVVEGYNLGKTPGLQGRLHAAEWRGVVLELLFAFGIEFVEVSPSTLKLYATGKGNADKAAMVSAALGAGGLPRNDDEADAFWLRAWGIDLLRSLEPNR